MISQSELPEFIEHNMPELSGICSKEQSRNVYDIARNLFKYTATQIAKHNINAAKKCMALAEQLYNNGNVMIKNAIENVYVFSFSHAFFSGHSQDTDILEIVPPSLYELYRKQLIGSHL